MIKELTLSACVMAALFALVVGATGASTFVAQVLLTGMCVALSFYYVTNHNYCLAMDTALAKKSLMIAAVGAMPVASLL